MLTSGEGVAENGLYQIPVISVPTDSGSGVQIAELPYGIYQVTVFDFRIGNKLSFQKGAIIYEV